MYVARVLEVLIASPSDTTNQREAIRQAVVEWNVTNARYYATVLLPVMWETHSYPRLGEHPQAQLNYQIVDDADILIATFWTRLGSPTENAESGTVEEIERFCEQGKHVSVYFSEEPTAPLTDPDETRRLIEYREKLKTEGLFGSYGSIEDCKRKVRDDLTKYIQDQDFGSEPPNLGANETSPRSPRSGSGGATAADPDRLADLRSAFTGFVQQWITSFAALENDAGLDRRYELARQIEAYTLEVIRLAATTQLDLPLLGQLNALAVDAANVSLIRVYLDGGQSFRALTDGCKRLVETAQRIAALPWQPGEDAAR